ncbi:MAG: TIGR04149 family rSAM-modified RiPP [Dysgonamonadaceae bacterium]
MKKLSKLNLNDYHEMNSMDMKNVIGGTGGTGTGTGTGINGEYTYSDHVLETTYICRVESGHEGVPDHMAYGDGLDKDNSYVICH